MFLVNTWADRIFLGYYSDAESVGVYSIAVKIALLVSFILAFAECMLPAYDWAAIED